MCEEYCTKDWHKFVLRYQNLKTRFLEHRSSTAKHSEICVRKLVDSLLCSMRFVYWGAAWRTSGKRLAFNWVILYFRPVFIWRIENLPDHNNTGREASETFSEWTRRQVDHKRRENGMLLIHFDYSLHWFYEISEAHQGTDFLLMISFIVNTCLLTNGNYLIGHTLGNMWRAKRMSVGS